MSSYPGNLRSDIVRDYTWITRDLAKILLYDCVYGAYNELFSVLSPEITLKDQGKYVGPFGEFRIPREDIEFGLTNGTDTKLWDYVEKKISWFF